MADGPVAGLEYMKTVLENNWEPSVTGRLNNVPEPQIALEGSETQKRLTMDAGDLCFVRDGGPQSITPKSVGWSEERIETLMTLDFRTNVSRARLNGGRDANNEAERYGGLRGEAKRILDEIRTGDQEFDWISGYEWNDLSSETGFHVWRGTWEIRLTQIAPNIDPSI